MGAITQTVPVRADERYKRAFKQVAADHGLDMGDLVREALDAKYGEQIERWLFLLEKSQPKRVESIRENA